MKKSFLFKLSLDTFEPGILPKLFNILSNNSKALFFISLFIELFWFCKVSIKSFLSLLNKKLKYIISLIISSLGKSSFLFGVIFRIW